jgi:hypothetical protein
MRQTQHQQRLQLLKKLREPIAGREIENSCEFKDCKILIESFIPNVSRAFKQLHSSSITLRCALEDSLPSMPSMQGVLSQIGAVDRGGMNLSLGTNFQDSEKVCDRTSNVTDCPCF